MTVLRSGISAHTTVVTVDAPLSNPSYPLFYDLDSETIKVVDGADTTEWQVERGVADTQQARHAKSVQLVANANPYGGGGGGVSVDPGTGTPVSVDTIVAAGAQISGSTATLVNARLVGPVRVQYNTASLNGAPGITWGDLPAGSVLVSAWAVIIDSFDDGSTAVVADLYLGVRDFATHGGVGQFNAIHYAVGGTDPSERNRSDDVVPGEFPSGTIYSFPIVAQAHAELMAYLFVTGTPGPLTQGDADIYALIATPAS